MTAIRNLISRWETREGKTVIGLLQSGSRQPDLQQQLLHAIRMLAEGKRSADAGVIDLRGIRLTDVDFSNITFDHVDLSFAQLANCKFRNTAWKNIRFEYSEVRDCLFEQADVFVTMAHSLWTGCRVVNSYIRILFSDCKFSSLDCIESKIRFGGAWAAFYEVNLERCEIYPSRTNNSGYHRVNIKECSEIVVHAPACTFNEVDFYAAHFRNSSFQKSRFTACNLQHSSVVDSDLHDCEFAQCDLRGAKFHNVASSNSQPITYIGNQTDQFVITAP